MSIHFSSVISARSRGAAGTFAVKSLDLDRFGLPMSPVLVLDDFRVSSQPFGPHPHAGFAAVTYVLPNSEGGLRSRDSLGNDHTVAPGGIVWTHAGSGVIHEELPATIGRELHGLQIFVNLTSQNKLSAASIFKLDSDEVPEWRNAVGDSVRVLVGKYRDVASPLTPIEPFNLFDMYIEREVSVELPAKHIAMLYVMEGGVVVGTAEQEEKLEEGMSVALHGDGGEFSIEAVESTHIVILMGAEINEPLYVHGPFMMTNRIQVEQAIKRFQTGEMGTLERASLT